MVSDSKVAVSWVNKGDFGCLEHVNTVMDIRSGLSAVGGMEVVFDSRIFNSFADCLAKMGSNHDGDFMEWADF